MFHPTLLGRVGRPRSTLRDELLLAPVAGQLDAWSLGAEQGSDAYYVL